MPYYTYNNIDFYYGKFKIGIYNCYYEYYFSDNIYTIYLSNYEDENKEKEYSIQHTDLKKAKALLRKKIQLDIQNKKINDLINNDFKIYLNLPDVLKDCFLNVGYHISNKANTKSILENGLIPNFQEDIAVKNASEVIDRNKPDYIPNNFNRKDCVYLHPSLCNDFFSKKEAYYKNCSLFAVNINNYLENSFIASSGLGGFCLHEEKNETSPKNLKKYSKLYWKHSKKLKDFIINPPKNSVYDFSEIIINTKIPSAEITYIGYWDKEGTFHFNKNFKNFIKSKYKNNYKDILNLYV